MSKYVAPRSLGNGLVVHPATTYADSRKQVRKALPYSIQEIGSPTDYAKWKEVEAIDAARRLLESDARNALKLEKATAAFMFIPGVEPILETPALPTLKDKFLNVCATVWRNAFDSER